MRIEDEVNIRRQWNNWRIASVDFSKLHDLHWDWTSGGVRAPSPQPFIHAFVMCDEIEGEIAHSCAHGKGPHSIKVVIVKKDNTPEMWAKLLSIVGPKPK